MGVVNLTPRTLESNDKDASRPPSATLIAVIVCAVILWPVFFLIASCVRFLLKRWKAPATVDKQSSAENALLVSPPPYYPRITEPTLPPLDRPLTPISTSYFTVEDGQALPEITKVIPAERVLGIDKRSFLENLPRLEATQSCSPRFNVSSATEICINPHEVEFGPNTGIFPHLATIPQVDEDNGHTKDYTQEQESPPAVLNHSSEASSSDLHSAGIQNALDESLQCSWIEKDDLETSEGSKAQPPIADPNLAPELDLSGIGTKAAISSDKNIGNERSHTPDVAAHTALAIDKTVEYDAADVLPTNFSFIDIASPTEYENIDPDKGSGKVRMGDVTVLNDFNVYTMEHQNLACYLQPTIETDDSTLADDIATDASSIEPALEESVTSSSLPSNVATSSTASPATTTSYSSFSPISTVCAISPEFRCSECSMAFRTLGARRTHYHRKHVRRYACSSCSRSFHLHADLKRHQRTIHRTGDVNNCSMKIPGLKCPNSGCKNPKKEWEPNRKDNFSRHVARCRKAIAKTGRRVES